MAQEVLKIQSLYPLSLMQCLIPYGALCGMISRKILGIDNRHYIQSDMPNNWWTDIKGRKGRRVKRAFRSLKTALLSVKYNPASVKDGYHRHLQS